METTGVPDGRLSTGDAVALGLATVVDGYITPTITRFGIKVDPDTQRREIIFE